MDAEIINGILVPFGSTFFGVLLAFLSGILGTHFQRKNEDNRRRLETKNSIGVELRGIDGEIASTFKLWEQKKLSSIPHIDLSTDSKESSIASGRFTLIETELQIKISHIYAVVERAVDYRARMLDVPPGTYNHSAFSMYEKNFRNQLDHLKEYIPPLLEELGIDSIYTNQ